MPKKLPPANVRLDSKTSLNTPASGTTGKLIYSEKEKILEVELRSGKIFQYLPVPLKEWKAYSKAIEAGNSSGQFYNREIKPKYDYREVVVK